MEKLPSIRLLHGLCALALFAPTSLVHAQQGEWDGKTASAHLQGPYEDLLQAPPRFGVVSYFNQPWRAYMDTWPASIWVNSVGVTVTGNDNTIEAQATILREAGIHNVRMEISWNNLNWDEQLRPDIRKRLIHTLTIYKQNGLRPLILLNAHHGAPVPIRDIKIQLLQDAAQGDRTVKLAPGSTIRVGYTGFANLKTYKAAFPLITALAQDGTAQLSAPLPVALKAGTIPLQELKYQPFQGTRLKDGTPVPAAMETFNGWSKYVAAVGKLAREVLGTPTDSGFDIEVWNERTFGSDFLNIERYYDPKPQYAEKLSYEKDRPWTAKMRPDAQLHFKQDGSDAILPLTIDYFSDPLNGFYNVGVNSGFSNQWPWNSGSSLWDGQNGLDKHYYTSSQTRTASPETPFIDKNHGSINALGQLDGIKAKGDWFEIEPGTNFVPRVTLAFPEWPHSAFQTETLQRDLFPDSRLSHAPSWMGRYGRYTHNGDFRTPKYWQTEVNFDRSPWIRELAKQSGIKITDPRFKKFNDATNSKHLLRQALFDLHKGIDRMYFFATDAPYYQIGLFPPEFFQELKKSDGKLTPEARDTLPQWPAAFKRISDLLNAGEPILAPRQLRVDDLVEHQPRLVFAGDGTPAHPSRFNRDFFAFLPFQISNQKFAIPYYVVTPDVTHSWNPQLDLLDPARYDMPPQDFEVTVGNLNGVGAKISAFDPLSGQSLPVKILKATSSTLTLSLPTTDAPRFLVIKEARPSIQITNAKIEAPQPGEAILSWTLNRPASTVQVTYGGDWTQRGTNVMTLKSKLGQTVYRVKLPAPGAEMVAARIRVEADGLTAVWPRWDEDPQGQITLPNAKPHPRGKVPAAPAFNLGPPTPLLASDDVVLTRTETNKVRNYALKLPANSVISGPMDDRIVLLGQGENLVTLRIQFLEGAAKNEGQYLPFRSSTDRVTDQSVTLSGGLAGILSSYELSPIAYPAVTDTVRRYLQIPLRRDLLLLSATGSPSAMKVQEANVTAIFASVR